MHTLQKNTSKRNVGNVKRTGLTNAERLFRADNLAQPASRRAGSPHPPTLSEGHGSSQTGTLPLDDDGTLLARFYVSQNVHQIVDVAYFTPSEFNDAVAAFETGLICRTSRNNTCQHHPGLVVRRTARICGIPAYSCSR